MERQKKRKENEEKKKTEGSPFRPQLISKKGTTSPSRNVFEDLYQNAVVKIEKQKEKDGTPRRSSVGGNKE